jgi:hypothetical protein
VTTNWDTYFEDESSATAFVEDKDISLWDVAERKVLKVHGTIANLGSIVATRTDYKKCARKLNTGVIGGLLKSLLATRTTVFIGYSLRDDDLLQLYNATRKHLADFHRQAYFIAPQISEDDRSRLTGMNLRLIETDGTFFVSKLKEHAYSKLDICSDEMYEAVGAFLHDVQTAHIWLNDTFNVRKHPQILIANWYQDGLLHALERIVRLRNSGRYSDRQRLIGLVQSYEQFGKRYLRQKNYSDAAYCEGYANGMLYALASQDGGGKPPLFFHFNLFISSSRSAYQRAINKLPAMHKGMHKYLTRVVDKYPGHDGIVIHHKAQLNLREFLADH